MTMEITNDRLEEAIREYASDRTKERLAEVLNLLRPTKLLVPAMLQAPNQPTPCFLKNNEGEQFLVVYTSKAQIPEEPKSQALLSMPFPVCNDITVKPELNLNGMVINPFSDNLVLKLELVRRLHEADRKAASAKQVKMTPQQFDAFVKQQVEFGSFPQRLFREGEAFVEELCDKKEEFVNRIFAEAYQDEKLYPYSEADYDVMALDIAEDLTLVRIDLPNKGLVAPLCSRIYVTFDPLSKQAGYYTIELAQGAGGKKMQILGQMDEKGGHSNYGEAPVEGAQLQKIMDLARCSDDDGNVLTS